MARQGLDGVTGPLADLLAFAKRVVWFQLRLIRHEARKRVSAIVMALVLVLLTVALLTLVLVLLVQAGLLALQAAGLTPLQALLVAAMGCGLLAVAMLLMARASLTRALRPLSADLGLPPAPPPA